MSALQAARMGDQLGAHGSAKVGLFAGLVAGVAVGVALGFAVLTAPVSGPLLAIAGACIAVGGTISLGAIGAKLGKHWGAAASAGAGAPCGCILSGSPDTKIGGMSVARAGMDLAGPCAIAHLPPAPLMQGSSTVFVNGKPLVRETESGTCGGKVITHASNVWIGGAPGGGPGGGVPDWASDDNLDRLALGGGVLGLAGSVAAVGAVTTAAMTGIGYLASKVGKLGGARIGALRDQAQHRTDHKWEKLYGESGETGLGLLAGLGAAGRGQGKLGSMLSRVVGRRVPFLNRQGIVRGIDAPIISPLPRAAPAEDAALFSMKKEGLGWTPEEGLSSKSLEYSRKMQRAVDDVRARVESAELKDARSAMDALAEQRAQIAREQSNPDAADFGAARDPVAEVEGPSLTPLRDEHGRSPYEYIADRAEQGLGMFRDNHIDLGGEKVPVTKLIGKWMVHSPPQSTEPIMARVEVLYAKAMNPALSPEETTAAVAEIHYLLAHAMPYKRGSAGITDGLTKLIFQSRGMKVAPWKEGIVPDLEALVTLDMKGFVARYASMSERPPSMPEGALTRASQGGGCTTCGSAKPMTASSMESIEPRSLIQRLFTYKKVKAELFGEHGPRASDGKQGDYGDCYLIAALKAMARQKPDLIANSVVKNADGTYTVTFRTRARVHTKADGTQITIPEKLREVTVTDDIPRGAAKQKEGNWVQVLEKAYAQAHGKGRGYEGIGDGGRAEPVLEQFGLKAYELKVSPKKPIPFADVKGDFDAGHVLVAETGKNPGVPGLPDEHAYAVTDVYYHPETGVPTVDLTNPWNGGSGERSFSGPFAGDFSLSYDQFTSGFGVLAVGRAQ